MTKPKGQKLQKVAFTNPSLIVLGSVPEMMSQTGTTAPDLPKEIMRPNNAYFPSTSEGSSPRAGGSPVLHPSAPPTGPRYPVAGGGKECGQLRGGEGCGGGRGRRCGTRLGGGQLGQGNEIGRAHV